MRVDDVASNIRQALASGSSTPARPPTYSPAGTLRVPADPVLAAAARRTWGDDPVLWMLSGNYEPYEYVTGYDDKAGTSMK